MSEPIEVVRRPPERGRRAPVVAPCMCCCCCCCCCCLHTVGGLVGAMVGSATKTAAEVAIGSPAAGTLYWTVLAILVGGGPVGLIVLGFGLDGSPGGGGFDPSGVVLGWAILLALALPALQLAASLISLVVIAIRRPPDAGLWYSRIGRITTRTILGTVIGGAALILLGIGLLGLGG